MLQVADYIAKSGQDVLLFSLEMSKLEMVSKSLSRELFKMDALNALTTRDIMNGNYDIQIMGKVLSRQMEAAKHIKIIEGGNNTGTKEIREMIETHIRYTGKKPVVKVDYLQIIKPYDFHMSAKQANDYNVSELKRISRDIDIPLVAISSLNRENYVMPIGFESFKETGAIEYGADVVLGLQLSGITEIAELKKESEKRERVNKLKSEMPRSVDLVVLKQRNGVSFARMLYFYEPRYNYFVEDHKTSNT
jgi:replicative DNA helicase